MGLENTNKLEANINFSSKEFYSFANIGAVQTPSGIV